MDYKLMRNKRRAISSVVGLFFFIVVMVGAFTAFILMMETNTEFLNTQLDISQHELAKLQEDFVIFAETQPYRDDSGVILFGHNQFNITVDVENKGKTPVEVVNLWIINKTLPSGASCETDSSEPCEANLVEINYADSFVPVRSTVNILENIPVTMQRGNYDLKVVTSLGNIKILPIRVGGSPLHLKLFAVPAVVPNLSNMTLVFSVTNNSTKTLYDIKPNDRFPTVIPTNAIAAQTVPGWPVEEKVILNEPKMIPQLRPGESTQFTMEYELRGAQGSNVFFTTNVTAKKHPDSPDWTLFSNNDTVLVKMTSELGEDLAGAKIRQKPEIFLIFPNPAGPSRDDKDRAFFGAMIVNPTNQTATIDRVIIQMTTPTTGGSDQIIIMKEEEHFDHIEPCCLEVDLEQNGGNSKHFENYNQSPDGKLDGIGRWIIPNNNLLVWTNDDITNPLVIYPDTAQAFIIKIQTIPSAYVPSFLIVANAHTSMGQFAAASHTSSAREAESKATLVNVYPTSLNVYGFSDYDDGTDFLIDAIGTVEANSQNNVFNFTIREGMRNKVNYVPGWGSVTADTGVKLIVKVPPGFPKINSVCCNPDGSNFDQKGFIIDETSPRFVEFRDGSIQMEVKVGDTSAVDSSEHHLGDDEGGDFVERFTFQYSLNGPDVKKNQIYIYHIFANGRDVFDNPVGPVSESVVLRVVGTEEPCFGKQGELVQQEVNGEPRLCE